MKRPSLTLLRFLMGYAILGLAALLIADQVGKDSALSDKILSFLVPIGAVLIWMLKDGEDDDGDRDRPPKPPTEG